MLSEVPGEIVGKKDVRNCPGRSDGRVCRGMGLNRFLFQNGIKNTGGLSDINRRKCKEREGYDGRVKNHGR